MADQDFTINIRTLADTTGIKLTKAELEALEKAAAQGNEQAIGALTKLKDAQQAAPVVPAGGGLGLGGTTAGIATIVTLLTGAIAKWREFTKQQDEIIDKMFEATARMREEALEVAKIKDLDFSEQLNQTGDLAANIERLTHKVAVLHGEQDALDPLTQAKEWKELRTEIAAYEHQLDSLRSKQKQQRQEELSSLKQRKSELEEAAQKASPQVRAELMQEQAARRARAEGRGRDADLFERSAEKFRRSMTEPQRAELERFHTIEHEDKDAKAAREIKELKAYMQSVWGA